MKFSKASTLLKRIAAAPAATAFWEASTATYRKVCTVWVTSAKHESTRDRRMTQLIDLTMPVSRDTITFPRVPPPVLVMYETWTEFADRIGAGSGREQHEDPVFR